MYVAVGMNVVAVAYQIHQKLDLVFEQVVLVQQLLVLAFCGCEFGTIAYTSNRNFFCSPHPHARHAQINKQITLLRKQFFLRGSQTSYAAS